MDDRCRDLLRQSDQMFTRRGSLLSLWQSTADMFYPERRDFTQTLTMGEELASHLMESFPVVARRELGNAISTMLRPRAKQWFHGTTGREDLDAAPGVKRWLEHADKVMYRAIYDPKAQMVRATKQGDHDYVSFGNAVISYGESPSRDTLFFQNWHLRDNAWAEDDSGAINRNDRKMKMSARNIMRRWGNKAHPDIRRCASQDPFKEFDIRHIVLPTDEYDNYSRKGKGRRLPWTSIYVDVANESILQEGQKHEFGYIIPRWHLVSGFEYAFSPAATAALGDGRMLQDIARILIEASEKSLDPPLVATMEALRSDVNIYAGGITWVDAQYDERLGNALRPLETGNNIPVGFELQNSVRQLLAQAWFINKLTVPSQGDMTATEFQGRVEEYIRGALPIFEPIEHEYNSPLLDGAFSVLMRNGAFDYTDMPDELKGKDISFSFESPIQSSEKTLKVVAFQQVAQISASATQLRQTDQTMDWDQATRDAMEGAGAPAGWFKDEAETEAEQGAQQQQAALGSVANLLAGGAGVAGQVADASMKLQEAGLV